MNGQLDLVDMLAATRSVDQRTSDLLDLVAGDPTHADDRATVVAAIVADADKHAGIVDPNRVRAALTGDHGLTVYPRVIGAVYSALAKRGALTVAGVTTNTDTDGGNAGKPQRTYRLTDRGAAA